MVHKCTLRTIFSWAATGLVLFAFSCKKSEIEDLKLGENRAEKGSGYDLVTVDVTVEDYCYAYFTVELIEENFKDLSRVDHIAVLNEKGELIAELNHEPYKMVRVLNCNGNNTYTYLFTVADKQGEISKAKEINVTP